MARDRDDLSAARAQFEESLAWWRELNDQPALARGLSNLANIMTMQKEFSQARELYKECLAIFRQLGDRSGAAWVLNHEGDAAREQGDVSSARALCEESLQTFRELNDRWGIAGSLADLGNLALEERDFAGADAFYRESIAIFQELEHKRGIARLLEAFACSAAAQSKLERSLRLAGVAAALRQSIGAPLTPAEQEKLDLGLHRARAELTTDVNRKVWLEGWTMPVEKAVEELQSLSAI